MQTIFVTSFFVMLVCGIIAWGCQIYVVRKLKKSGYEGGRAVGRSSFILPLSQGWKYAKELEIIDVMAFWSFMLGVTILSGIVLLIAGIPLAK